MINNTCGNKTNLFIFSSKQEIYRRRVLGWHGQNIKRFRARKFIGERPARVCACVCVYGDAGRVWEGHEWVGPGQWPNSPESPLDIFGSLWQTLVTVARSLTADRDDVSLSPPPHPTINHPPTNTGQIIHYARCTPIHRVNEWTNNVRSRQQLFLFTTV